VESSATKSSMILVPFLCGFFEVMCLLCEGTINVLGVCVLLLLFVSSKYLK
jgi:hypothetical protein